MAKQIQIDLSGKNGMTQAYNSGGYTSYISGGSQTLNEDNNTYNPFVRYGYMSPTTNKSTAVTFDYTLSAGLDCSIYDQVSDNIYFGEAASQLFIGSNTTDISLTRVANITGGIIKDLEISTINISSVPTRVLMVSYKDSSGNADIAISPLPYSSTTENLTWLSLTAAGGFSNTANGDIFILSSDNGFSYLFNENQVHKIDGITGADGTITPNVLLFPKHFRMVDAIDNRGFIYIAVHQYPNDTRSNNPTFIISSIGKCGVYIWDRKTSVGNNDYVPVNDVREISKIYVTPKGKVRIIAINTSGITIIKEYTGNGFETIQYVGYNAYPTYRDSLSFIDDLTVWNSRKGKIYGHGPIMPNSKDGLFPLFRQNVGQYNAGAIMIANSTTIIGALGIYSAYTTTSSVNLGRIRIVKNVGSFSLDTMDGSIISYPVEYLPVLSTVSMIRFYCVISVNSDTTTVGNITVRINQTANPIVKTITKKDISKGYFDIEINKQYVNTIQISLAYPGIVNLSTDDLALSFAIVDYTPTSTK